MQSTITTTGHRCILCNAHLFGDVNRKYCIRCEEANFKPRKPIDFDREDPPMHPDCGKETPCDRCLPRKPCYWHKNWTAITLRASDGMAERQRVQTDEQAFLATL